MIRELQVKEIDGRKFYYCDFGREDYGRTSFRLWVHHSLVKTDEEGRPYIEFPIENARLDRGKSSKTVILRPDESKWTGHYFVACGYRGSSSIILDGNVSAFRYYEYASPRGSLGVSEGVLFTTEVNPVKVKWERSGRLYGKPGEGLILVYKNGEVQEIEEVDLCDIEDLAEVIS